MSTLYLVQGDTNPRVNFTITHSNGTAMDLTSATVKFTFIKLGSDTPIFSLRSCSLDVPANGTCYYDWQSGDLDEAGNYVGELQVTLPSGKVQTIKTLQSYYVRPQLA